MKGETKANGLRKVPRRGTRELLRRAVDALLRDIADGNICAVDGAAVIEAVTKLVASGAFYLPATEKGPKRAYTLEALEKAALDVLHEFGARSEGWGCPSLRNLQTVLADAPNGMEPVLERGSFRALDVIEHANLVALLEESEEAAKEIARFKLIEEAARRAYLAGQGSDEERLAINTVGVLLGLRGCEGSVTKEIAGGGPGDAPASYDNVDLDAGALRDKLRAEGARVCTTCGALEGDGSEGCIETFPTQHAFPRTTVGTGG